MIPPNTSTDIIASALRSGGHLLHSQTHAGGRAAALAEGAAQQPQSDARVSSPAQGCSSRCSGVHFSVSFAYFRALLQGSFGAAPLRRALQLGAREVSCLRFALVKPLVLSKTANTHATKRQSPSVAQGQRACHFLSMSQCSVLAMHLFLSITHRTSVSRTWSTTSRSCGKGCCLTTSPTPRSRSTCLESFPCPQAS